MSTLWTRNFFNFFTNYLIKHWVFYVVLLHLFCQIQLLIAQYFSCTSFGPWIFPIKVYAVLSETFIIWQVQKISKILITKTLSRFSEPIISVNKCIICRFWKRKSRSLHSGKNTLTGKLRYLENFYLKGKIKNKYLQPIVWYGRTDNVS